MAVVLDPKPSRITIVRETGSEDGKAILKSKTINNVKSDATHQDIFEVVQALSQLFSHPIVYIERVDSGILTEL